MLWKNQWMRAALPLAAIVAIGCGEDTPTSPGDAAPRDIPVTTDRPVVMDTGPADTGPGQDSTVPTDTPPADTGTPDVKPADTGPVDTGPPPDAGCMRDDQCPAGLVCMAGACVMGCNDMHACPMGATCCANACVDTATSLTHCGACGAACTAPSGTPTCAAGRCTVTGCMGTNADCDMMASTGCETDTATSLTHCGMCGRACTAPANATSTCAMGTCGFTCATGFANCDGMAANGCETDTRTSAGNCGACGTVCMFANAAASCATGTCGFMCNTGFGNCDGMATNGCETNTQTSVANCGACGTACVTPNATPACAAGACAVGTCNDGFGNCDMMAATGCEINLRTDRANCGACGRACGAGQTCAAGSCQFGNGSAGPLTVVGTQTVNDIRAGASGTAGMNLVTITAVIGTFAAGQEVILHQTQAATGSVGQYEYARVVTATATGLVLEGPLVNTYTTDSTNHAQVVVVPEFTTVTVPSGATLTGPAWNGTSGGILAFDAGGAVSVVGTVHMNGQGFRGNRRVCGTTPIYRCMRGVAGEGERGPGRANILFNGSGGGGGGAGQDCASGGGGGYGLAGDIGTRGTGGTCAETDHPPGAGGSTSGTASLAASVLFGGAGGEGGADEDGYGPGGGGNGGGAVIFRATTVAVTGTVNSDGTSGLDGNQAGCAGSAGSGCGMGGGGGGAGGAVRVIAVTSATVGTNRLTVASGGGGFCSCGTRDFAAGQGGNGRIGILSPMTTGASVPVFNRE